MEEDLKKIITTGIAELKEQQRIIEKALKEIKEIEAKEAEGTSGKPISQLSEVTSLSNEAVFPLVQDSTTSKATIGALKGLILQNTSKLSIQTSYQYFLSEAEYDLSSHFMIDENSKSYLDGNIYQIVIPFNMTKSSSKIIRFTRLNGVKMQVANYTLSVSPANSIRVNIATENSDGSINEVQDLVYMGEFIDIFISYSNNKLTSAKLLTQLPLLQVKSTMSYNFLSNSTNLTFGAFGMPCSQLFECYDITETFEYTPSLLCNLGNGDNINPFFRSLILTGSVADLKFNIKNNVTPIDTEYRIRKSIEASHLMLNTSNEYFTAPLGGHFPRFQQVKDNYIRDETDSTIIVEGDTDNIYHSDTTGKHQHTAALYNAYTADSGSNNVGANSTVSQSTSYNDSKVSYESAGRWAGLQAWIYL